MPAWNIQRHIMEINLCTLARYSGRFILLAFFDFEANGSSKVGVKNTDRSTGINESLEPFARRGMLGGIRDLDR
jgi:hypothetical protein